MKNYLKKHEWKIVEQGFDPENVLSSESIFSIGNGKMGQRANFEEKYSGKSLQGNYIAGVYYPDKTKVGWWKNGYPEYFAKVLNATHWIGINVKINEEELDLHKAAEIIDFQRVLNMKEGFLERNFTVCLQNKNKISVRSQRFLSIVNDTIGVIRYAIKAENFNGKISLSPYLDGDVKNADANYDEKFWDEVGQSIKNTQAMVSVRTKKTNFVLTTSMNYEIWKNKQQINIEAIENLRSKYAESIVNLDVKEGDELVIYKYVSLVSSFSHPENQLSEVALKEVERAKEKGFYSLLEEQKKAWAKKWEKSDICIKGDLAAQQAIRFNIFQLNQTYTGKDERLNIGPKGFTGEKYGGTTYWDTEAYCLPFFLATAESSISRNLLIYRYKHLEKAIENAQKLGFSNGAALFPMVTANGEECHNEWEITFEEIHRNGAIAFAVYNYIRYTNDKAYLIHYGLELLIAIARFWSQRTNFSENYKKYVILGVTGPNEYENNVDNNWYTNTIAVWCLEYTMEAIDYVKNNDTEKYNSLVKKIQFDEQKECKKWQEIAQNMHFPEDKKLGIFLQQDNYLNKEQILVKNLSKSERPLNQKWSWDRILRSCFIKQADTLQGIYLFEEKYDLETIRRNFDFYESRTVHESSLSPCVHAILAAKLSLIEKAYELFMRTARLDLDDYNNEVGEGLHITSMAGTWMAVVQGFGGMRVVDNHIYLEPQLPKNWEAYSFTVNFRNTLLKVSVLKDKIEIENQKETSFEIFVCKQKYSLKAKQTIAIPYKF